MVRGGRIRTAALRHRAAPRAKGSLWDGPPSRSCREATGHGPGRGSTGARERRPPPEATGSPFPSCTGGAGAETRPVPGSFPEAGRDPVSSDVRLLSRSWRSVRFLLQEEGTAIQEPRQAPRRTCLMLSTCYKQGGIHHKEESARQQYRSRRDHDSFPCRIYSFLRRVYNSTCYASRSASRSPCCRCRLTTLPSLGHRIPCDVCPSIHRRSSSLHRKMLLRRHISEGRCDVERAICDVCSPICYIQDRHRREVKKEGHNLDRRVDRQSQSCRTGLTRGDV